MFSRNLILFVATTAALAAPAQGQSGGVHLVPTATQDLEKFSELTEENVRAEAGGGRWLAMMAGCVTLRKVRAGEAVEPRDLVCAPAADGAGSRLDPRTL